LLYSSASEQGDAAAQFGLGVIYANGQGVPQDYVRAHMWFNLAASSLGGDEGKLATENREDVAQKMTPHQIERAQDMARICEASNFTKCD